MINVPGIQTARPVGGIAPLDYSSVQKSPLNNLVQGIQAGSQMASQAQARELRAAGEARAAELAPFQLQNAQQTAQMGAEKQRMSSLVMGAAEIVNLPPEQQLAALQQRAATLLEQETDNSDTLEAIELLQANPEAFQETLNSAVTFGEQSGILQQLTGGQQTAALKEFKYWKDLPDGPDKKAFGIAQGYIPKAITAKTSAVNTPTGTNVINNQTGEVIKKIIDPDKQKQFNEDIAARQQANKTRIREEKAEVKAAKIAELDAVDAKKAALQTTSRAFNLTNKLSKEGVIDAVTGKWDSWTPTLFGSSQDVVNDGLELKNLLTLGNLKLMSGVLSETDIKILSNAASGLQIDESGFLGSEKQVRNKIIEVQEMLYSKLENAVLRGTITLEEFQEMTGGE